MKLLDGWIVDVQDVLTTVEDLFFFFFGHLMAGDIDKVTSQPLRLYILYVSYLVTPLVFLNSRGERREISSGY